MKIKTCLSNFCGRKINRHRRDHILRSELNLSEKSIASLFDILDLEDSYTKISLSLRWLSKSKGASASLAKEGLCELDMIKSSYENLSVRLPLIVSLNLIFNPHEYDGVIFQVIGERKTGKNSKLASSTPTSSFDVLAAGGRYDALVDRFRKPTKTNLQQTPNIAAVGLSLAFDTIAAATASASASTTNDCQYDVLLCSVGHKGGMLKEKLSLAQALWKSSIRADFLQEPVANLEDLQDYCRKTGVSYLVVFKDKESGFVRVKSWADNERAVDRKLAVIDAPAFFVEKLSSASIGSHEPCDGVPQFQAKNETVSLVNPSASSSLSATLSNVRIHYVSAEKLSLHTRKRYDAQMASSLATVIRRFSNKETLDVVSTDLPGSVIKFLSGVIECREENLYKESLREVFVKFHKFKYQLNLLTDEVWKMKFETADGNSNVILYSYVDDVYRLII